MRGRLSHFTLSRKYRAIFRGGIAANTGELAGNRTQDPRLKRALLYQLSYELFENRFFQTTTARLGSGVPQKGLLRITKNRAPRIKKNILAYIFPAGRGAPQTLTFG